METVTYTQIAAVLEELKINQKTLDDAILRTPTGDARNKLTDANMKLMIAIDVVDKLGEAYSEPPPKH